MLIPFGPPEGTPIVEFRSAQFGVLFDSMMVARRNSLACFALASGSRGTKLESSCGTNSSATAAMCLHSMARGGGRGSALPTLKCKKTSFTALANFGSHFETLTVVEHHL
jgi:hypothetical protein